MSYLLFMVDGTTSMSAWIAALNVSLPLVIQSMSITAIFDKIGVCVYRDYDCSKSQLYEFSGFKDCLNPSEIDSLLSFAKKMAATGGGGFPEAVKTCLLKIMDQICSTPAVRKVYIIHLADAPPHEIRNIDREGSMEKTELKNLFDWIRLTEHFLQMTPVPVRYMCLTTCIHSFNCHLAQLTGGDVYRVQGSVTKENLITEIGKVFNGFLGLDAGVEAMEGVKKHQKVERFAIVIPSGGYRSENELSGNIPTLTKDPCVPCPNLVGSVFTAVHRMKTEPAFYEMIVQEFRGLIQSNIMAFTTSPILGKMWREFTKHRSDERRDELIELFQKSKQGLSLTEKELMEDWVKESYDASMEIIDDLKHFYFNQPVIGLLRFVPNAVEQFSAQHMIQLLAAGDKKSTMLIRAMLSRLLVDRGFSLEMQIPVASDGEEIPFLLPDKSIPLNLPIHQFMELVLHTISPGTKLTRRYAAILSCHAIQCGSVIAELSKQYLTKVKGRWINWKRRPANATSHPGAPEVPENYSRSFLELILSENCLAFTVTEEEQATAMRLKQIAGLLSFYSNQIECTVQLIDPISIDSCSHGDYLMNCTDCAVARPLSLLNQAGVCGYCMDIAVGKRKREEIPETIQYLQTRCYTCGSLYCRNNEIRIVGHSKCYGCRVVGKPSPASECSVCHLSFVNWLLADGLPNQICKGCADGLAPRRLSYREYPVLLHQAFNGELAHFRKLCKTLGFLVDLEFKPHMSLPDADLCIRPHEARKTPDPPTDLTYRDTPIQNIPAIWKYALSIMKGNQKPELPECMVCLEQVPITQMIRACGRSGCEQRICIDCSSQWFLKNKPGTIIYQRATLCQFCGRLPSPQVIQRIHPQLMLLVANIAQLPSSSLQSDKYYAWCSTCLHPSEVGDRVCAAVAPNIVNHVCLDCTVRAEEAKAKDPEGMMEGMTRDCPNCGVTTFKDGGCNHIYCSQCEAHWCWECNENCGSAEETYNHMSAVHGRIYEGEEPQFDD